MSRRCTPTVCGPRCRRAVTHDDGIPVPVDGVPPQPGEASFERGTDVAVRAVAHLGGEEERVPTACRHAAERLAEHVLAGPVAIAGRGVEVVDAARERDLDRLEHPGPVAGVLRVERRHVVGQSERGAAEADPADRRACPTERGVLHGTSTPRPGAHPGAPTARKSRCASLRSRLRSCPSASKPDVRSARRANFCPRRPLGF
jgi:hypothetical protein